MTTMLTRARPALAVAVLAAAAVSWAALPAGGAAPGLRPLLAVAIACALLTVARVFADLPRAARGQASGYVGPIALLGRRSLTSLRVGPWPQGLVVAALGLEALHPSRPWHTVLLGVVLLGFLLTLHLAETSAKPSVFRPQVRFLAAGLCLAALSAGAAALPALGASAGWLAVLAAIAAVVVAALALPL
jgi:hypothetical protein